MRLPHALRSQHHHAFVAPLIVEIAPALMQRPGLAHGPQAALEGQVVRHPRRRAVAAGDGGGGQPGHGGLTPLRHHPFDPPPAGEPQQRVDQVGPLVQQVAAADRAQELELPERAAVHRVVQRGERRDETQLV